MYKGIETGLYTETVNQWEGADKWSEQKLKNVYFIFRYSFIEDNAQQE